MKDIAGDYLPNLQSSPWEMGRGLGGEEWYHEKTEPSHQLKTPKNHNFITDENKKSSET